MWTPWRRSPGKMDWWLIEDCCDAVWRRIQGPQRWERSATLATVSFYPGAPYITMGEGWGRPYRQPLLKTLVESFADWGRDCWLRARERQYVLAQSASIGQLANCPAS